MCFDDLSTYDFSKECDLFRLIPGVLFTLGKNKRFISMYPCTGVNK